LLARGLGHRVTGSDENVYPPMSTLLADEGIVISSGYDPDHLNPAPDLVVVGNAMSRGRSIVEYMLDANLAYTSGPQWFGENVLKNRSVIAVAGTHGKTTTSSMLSWILDQAGADPGFLIGGVPAKLDVSARLGSGPWFVVEADEYDTAFFDKRSKFVHYRPNVAILNNLEFDHADIFDDLNAIKRQFHHLLRIIPSSGCIISNAADSNLDDVIEMGAWTDIQYFDPPASQTSGSASQHKANAQSRLVHADGSCFDIRTATDETVRVDWSLIGDHNVANALAATLAARATGVSLEACASALNQFQPSRRRLELIADAGGIRVFDDFAHHPTAVLTTLQALRAASPEKRLIAAVELRSNTMQMGVHQQQLNQALLLADLAFVYTAEVSQHMLNSDRRIELFDDYNALEASITNALQANDQLVIMSNGSFDEIAGRIAQYVDNSEVCSKR